MRWLVYGAKGWIGSQVCSLINDDHKSYTEYVYHGTARVDDTAAVKAEILKIRPERIMCLIGRTHGGEFTTIDYLEQPGKLVENVCDNLFSPVSLALLCKELNVHLTYLGTGCIFSQNPDDIQESHGYTEDSTPDFFGSGYSTVKGFTDRLMHQLDVLNIRIRMPIVGYHHSRNFITKITQYSKVVNVQNSMTVLPDLLPIMIDLATKEHVGTINLTNPGTISHNEILDMYCEYVDPTFKYTNFTIDEQDKILDSKRSNNKLETSKLKELYPDVPNIQNAVKELFQKWGKEHIPIMDPVQMFSD